MISREDLIDSYAESIVEGMDHKSMEQFVYDVIVENLSGRSNQEIAEEVIQYDKSLFEISPSENIKDEEVVKKFVKSNKDN